MEDVKNHLQSKTVWGGIFTVIVSLGSIAGLVFAPEFIDQASVLAASIATTVTGLVTIYGRIVATTKLISKKK